MRWYEYKMETDDLYAPDDLKAKLLAMTDQLTEEEKAQPMMKTDAPVPAQSAPVQPKKKLIRFPAKRVGALAACLAVCVVGYGAFCHRTNRPWRKEQQPGGGDGGRRRGPRRCGQSPWQPITV